MYEQYNSLPRGLHSALHRIEGKLAEVRGSLAVLRAQSTVLQRDTANKGRALAELREQEIDYKVKRMQEGHFGAMEKTPLRNPFEFF